MDHHQKEPGQNSLSNDRIVLHYLYYEVKMPRHFHLIIQVMKNM